MCSSDLVGQAEQLDIATISIQDREQLGLLIVQRISQHHYQQHPPYTIESLSHELGLPMPLVTALIAALEQMKIIVECTNEEGGNLLPAQPFDQITLGEVWQALRHHGQQIPLLKEPLEVPLSDSQLASFNANPLFNITLKQLGQQSGE